MSQPQVSVVIPVHNRATLIGRALGSALAQDGAAMEIIIVDDGSSDDLAGVIAGHCTARALPTSVRTIRHSERRGAGAARNSGIAAARAPFIAFLDSDDEWLPGKLVRQLAILRAAPARTAVCLAACIMDRGCHGTQILTPPTDRPCRDVVVAGQALNFGTAALVRRSVFDEIGGFDEALERLEDWDWLLRLTRSRDYVCAPGPLAVVHVQDRQIAPAVERAVARIGATHGPTLAAESGSRARRFRASILVERAFRAYLAGDRLKTARLLAAATVLDPGRLPALLARVRRRLGLVPAGAASPDPSVEQLSSCLIQSAENRFSH